MEEVIQLIIWYVPPTLPERSFLVMDATGEKYSCILLELNCKDYHDSKYLV
jgi:hypothetical protein